MDKFFKIFFSMRMMTVGLFLFLASIATATFLESMHDTQTARIIIYNAWWFEVLLTYLAINLIANIFEHRMFRKEKISVLAFHLSFIVILIGSWTTRYISYDGMMMIREGERSNFLYSSDPYIWFKINDGVKQYTDSRKLLMSEITNNTFNIDVEFPNHKTPISIEYVDYQKNLVDSLIVNDSIKETSLEIVSGGMKSNYLTEKSFLMVGQMPLSFDKKDAMPGILVSKVAGKIMISSKIPFKYLPMAQMRKYRQSGQPIPEEMYVHIPKDSVVPFLTTTLYSVGQEEFVFKSEIKHSKMIKIRSGKKDVGSTYLIVKLTDGSNSKIVELEGGAGSLPTHEKFYFNGLTYEVEFGPKKIEIPFAIECRDFKLDKYPGSEMPSSFASEITLHDDVNNYKHEQRIFMNNVMDYHGYRFFQSAYDLDDPKTPENEEGTRLSVNHDWWGTNITYFGYLLMAIGMILSFFSPNSRFKELNNKLKATKQRRESLKTFLVLIALSFGSLTVSAQRGNEHKHKHSSHEHSKHEVVFKVMSKEHSEKLEALLVQDFSGRIVPLHTCFDELLRKIYKKNTFEKWNAVQTVMSMHMYPEYWMSQKTVSIEAGMQKRLKLGKYASFRELSGEDGQFKWIKEHNESHNKADSKRNEFDKKIIKLGERFEVLRFIFSWDYMKIIPVKSDGNNKWFVPMNMDLMKADSMSSMFALQYLSSLNNACDHNKYQDADKFLTKLKEFQRLEGQKVVPSESKVKIEIIYNKLNIFNKSLYGYLTIGFILLIIFFIRILVKVTPSSEKIFKFSGVVLSIALFAAFLFHGLGLGFRWYILDTPPWTNGYGAFIFISWVLMIMGFSFARKSPIILSGAAILASLILIVSEMSLMDPAITPVVPVLKSFWLKIHVSIITGSYAPLGLGCILALMNLILYIIRNEKNGKVITLHITEISYVSEMIITIGVFMLTIGTFLGGVWANESWGRYWAWDPKEVWALVSVLVYAIILHLRYIPGASGKFTFNVVTFWAYTSILFTYFGVNFYLKGLHSYAQGDGLGTVPNDIKLTIAIFALLTVIAFLRNRQYMKKTKVNS